MASIRKHKSKSKGNGFIVDYYDLDGIRKTKVLYTDRANASAVARSVYNTVVFLIPSRS